MIVKRNPRALIVRTAGTNCDDETAYAFEAAGARSRKAHINTLIAGEENLLDYDIMAIPGGFSYGDDIASGKILANEMRYGLDGLLKKFITSGRIIIGICNGFQVLVKSGILPNIRKDYGPIEATLSINDSAKFEDRWVYLKSRDANGRESRCVWTRGIDPVIFLPVAHAEGKFTAKDGAVMKAMRRNGQIVLRYASCQGTTGAGYPSNPNGSIDDIAGICDTSGRVFGLMPHPERSIQRTQNPYWTRWSGLHERDGLKIFRNGVAFVKTI